MYTCMKRATEMFCNKNTVWILHMNADCRCCLFFLCLFHFLSILWHRGTEWKRDNSSADRWSRFSIFKKKQKLHLIWILLLSFNSQTIQKIWLFFFRFICEVRKSKIHCSVLVRFWNPTHFYLNVACLKILFRNSLSAKRNDMIKNSNTEWRMDEELG